MPPQQSPPSLKPVTWDQVTRVQWEQSQSVPKPQNVPRQLVTSGINMVGEAAKTVANVGLHPIQTAGDILKLPYTVIKSHWDEAGRAIEAFGRGDRSEGVLRAIASIIPVAGPIAANYADADQTGKEQIAGGMIGGMTMGKVIPASVGVPRMRRGMNVDDARAIDAARAEGVPVNAGIATGNRAVQNMIQGAEKTTATGAGSINRSRIATEQGLEAMGTRLADETGGARGSLAQAGEGAADALQRQVSAHTSTAQRAYSAVESAQASGVVPPVSFAKVRSLLRPLYEKLDQLNKSTGGLDAATAPGKIKAHLDAIMQPQVKSGFGYVAGDVPILTAEDVLGNLKDALRNNPRQLGSTSGQLRTIIRVLQREIDTAAGTEPGVLDALKTGRLATVQKFQAEAMRRRIVGSEDLRSPILAAEQLLGDAGLKQVRRLAVQAPEAVRDLGRAWFEHQFNQARTNNGFDLRNSIREWRQMSDETKRIVYKDAIAKDPQYLTRVSDFFTAAARIQENLNPSGTGAANANYIKLALTPFEVVAGIASGNPGVGFATAGGVLAADVASGLFARAMNNPRVVDLLIKGMKIPGSSMAARAGNIAAIHAILQSGMTPTRTGAGPAGTQPVQTGRATGAGPGRR
jgi:hypothetical protein